LATPKFPDTERLAAGLVEVLQHRKPDGNVTIIGRKPNPQESTFPSEIVTCRLDDESLLRLFCKYGNREFDSVYNHRGNVSYEGKVYREILQPLHISTPTFYGVFSDRTAGTEWLIIEYVEEGVRTLWSSDPNANLQAARWIGRFHATNEKRLDRAQLSFLKRYDSEYYIGWARRTVQSFGHLTDFPWLLPVCEGFEKTHQRLLKASQTVIHGEYYGNNIMYQNGISRPADWQSAAIGPGEIDLAALTHMWPPRIVQECEREYTVSRWPDGSTDDFEDTLDLARVYMNLRWLGDPSNVALWARRSKGAAVPEKSRKFIEELRSLGERLGLA